MITKSTAKHDVTLSGHRKNPLVRYYILFPNCLQKVQSASQGASQNYFPLNKKAAILN